MSSFHDMVRAVLMGVVCGFVVSVPVGPVNLTVIHHALRRGFLAAFLVGLGAICAETIYAALMLAGHATVLDKPFVRDFLGIAALVLIVGVGVRSILMKPAQIEAGAAIAAKKERSWHHPRRFLLGFVLTISNLMLVVLWATLAKLLAEWELPARGYITGVFAGGLTWFLLLAFFVSRAHKRVNPTVLAWLVRSCGVVFLIFAGLLAVQMLKTR